MRVRWAAGKVLPRAMSSVSSSSSAPAAPPSSAPPAASSALAPAAVGSTYVCGAALTLRVDGVCGLARATTLATAHGFVSTPVFMPVGTAGCVKGATTLELSVPPLDCEIVLANTYHLGDRPGPAALRAAGGLHAFQAWPRSLLTDSGGFQMVSLLALARVTEEGVEFASPVDGRPSLLTPEQSMALQNVIGADVMMALDDVVGADTADGARFAEATERTLRWLDRCIAAHAAPAAQSLFGIAQGGLDVAPGGLRARCLDGLLARDASLPGYAIGGLAGGEAKDAFWRVVAHACARLPARKPRYLMGVGYPLDIVLCTALGVDMYDCVYPTRTGRFGTALVHAGLLKLRAAAYADDARPIDPTCACHVCAPAAAGGYSRAHLHAMLRARDASANVAQLVTHHNIAYMMRLVREMRRAIVAGDYAHYVRAFVHTMFPAGAAHVPGWVRDAAAAAGVDVADNTDREDVLALFRGTPTADSVPSADKPGPGDGGAGAAGDDDEAAPPAAKRPPAVA